ncbi:uncharacterized protein LOC143290735 [Babylonia areolata]|uniref:uncharacterized protein LOC143290735 n=1 Tax=Babylonia areolata TaxID=304850 RepID=UPI003FCFDA95
MQWTLTACPIYVMAVTSLVASGVLASMDKAMIDHILRIHNEMRAKEGSSDMPKLVWNESLATEAEEWANRCNFVHKGLGENLAWNSNKTADESMLIDRAMKAFYDEKNIYRYGQHSCGSACHYTQLTWAKTTQVGCSTRKCYPLFGTGQTGENWFLVCRYEPKLGHRAQKCKDDEASCKMWSEAGSCEKNPDYMLKNCKKSCKKCVSAEPEECVDEDNKCAQWAKRGECKANPDYMLKSCRKSCKKC